MDHKSFSSTPSSVYIYPESPMAPSSIGHSTVEEWSLYALPFQATKLEEVYIISMLWKLIV